MQKRLQISEATIRQAYKDVHNHYQYTRYCPVALAINRNLVPGYYCCAGRDSGGIYEGMGHLIESFLMPKNVQNIILSFDSYETVEDYLDYNSNGIVRFVIDLPDNVWK